MRRLATPRFLSVFIVVVATLFGVLAAPGLAQAARSAPRTAVATAKPVLYYLSLGDSYSVGYQPGIGATAGYTASVAKKTKMQLENFGCGGATTTSILTVIGCTAPYGPPAATEASPTPPRHKSKRPWTSSPPIRATSASSPSPSEETTSPPVPPLRTRCRAWPRRRRPSRPM